MSLAASSPEHASPLAAIRSLPLTPTPLIDRHTELDLARQRLLRPEVRLLTITGTGGTGKTRLAIRLAEVVQEHFSLGAHWVDLTPVRDPSLVLPTIGRSLGVREGGGRTILEALALAIGGESLLLVLDNFEHVLDAALGISELIERAPELKVLATSREPLRLRWEHEFPLLPLPVPPDDVRQGLAELADVPSVALFVQRAQAVQPAFALSDANATAIAELCRHLDGLPLAIELASARLKALPLPALVGRLERRLDLLKSGARDVPDRHQTLREAIRWSYDLLPAEQQALFRRLAVFSGGCTLEAAEAVSRAAPGTGLDVLDGLCALVERNLLLSNEKEEEGGAAGPEMRFRMLETVREYALECLETSGEAEPVRAAHAAYYLGVVESAEPETRGPNQRAWLDRLERDLGNLRAALRWLLDRGDPDALDAVARFGWALYRFLWARGYMAEGRRWMQEALDRGVDRVSPVARARAAWLVGVTALDQGDYAAAPPRIAECLALFRELGDSYGIARALLIQGYEAPIRGDWEQALAAHRECALRFREAGDEQGVATALTALANTAILTGDYAEAIRHNDEALAIARAFGDLHTQAQVLESLGVATLRQGEPDRALAHFRESVTLCMAVGSVELFCYCLVGLAEIAAARGSLQRAARLLGAAGGLRKETGLGTWPVRQPLEERLAAEVRAGFDAAPDELAAAWAAGRALTLDSAVHYALGEDGDPARAEKIAAAPPADQSAALLSAREREIASFIARGLTSREIAEALVVSERTIDAHADHIRTKLGLRSRAEIAAWAVAHGLAQPPA